MFRILGSIVFCVKWGEGTEAFQPWGNMLARRGTSPRTWNAPEGKAIRCDYVDN